MTWTNLLANKEAQKHKTSKKELDNMRALIARDLADAGSVRWICLILIDSPSIGVSSTPQARTHPVRQEKASR